MIERIIPIAVVDNNSLRKLFRLSVNDFSDLYLYFSRQTFEHMYRFFVKGTTSSSSPLLANSFAKVHDLLSYRWNWNLEKQRGEIRIKWKGGRKIEIYRNFNKRICKLLVPVVLIFFYLGKFRYGYLRTVLSGLKLARAKFARSN